MLGLYLLTGPHTTALGCFRLPDGYAMEDLAWPPGRVKKGFEELSRKGWADRCETTKWVLICNYLKWNPPMNPNQAKSLRRLAMQVPDACTLKDRVKALINEYCGREEQLPLISEQEAKPENPTETVSEPFRNQEQEQEQDQTQDQTQEQDQEQDIKTGARSRSSIELPEWLPLEQWKAFEEMRRKSKKPMTDRAKVLIFNKLEKFRRAGHDIAEILDKSTLKNWTDVYEPDLKKPQPPANGQPEVKNTTQDAAVIAEQRRRAREQNR